MIKKVSKRAEFGTFGEKIAAQFLERKGYKITKRNYRKPWGEIDIICEKGGVVHFIEVKAVSREIDSMDISRENMDYRPEEQIHPEKLKRIVRTAELFMSEKNDDREYQIDAIGILIDPVQRVARCRFFEQIL